MDDKLLTQITGHLGDLVCEVSRCADALDVLAIEQRRIANERNAEAQDRIKLSNAPPPTIKER